MKKFLFLSLASLLVLATACKKEGQVEASDAQETADRVAQATDIKIDPASSVIHWTGSKVAGKHTGTFKVKSGELQVKDGNIASGDFVIDMTSLTVTDLEGQKKADLEGHLKNADFFEVEANPTAKFEVVDSRKVENSDSGITHQITGNLTMNGKTKSITIPATVSTDGGFSAVTPEFTINRTDWDIKYGSGLLGVAKDKAISDDVDIKIELKG